MQAVPRFGYWWILLVSFLSLPLRGYIAAHLVSQAGLYPVQVLDGIGAGLQSVAVPGLVARMLEGSGRINAGQGAIMTVQGLGAALSPALGGWLVKYAGYSHAFLVLGSLAGISVVLWVLCRRHLNNCCAAEKKASWLVAAESTGGEMPKV
jgi:MFS family permease